MHQGLVRTIAEARVIGTLLRRTPRSRSRERGAEPVPAGQDRTTLTSVSAAARWRAFFSLRRRCVRITYRPPVPCSGPAAPRLGVATGLGLGADPQGGAACSKMERAFFISWSLREPSQAGLGSEPPSLVRPTRDGQWRSASVAAPAPAPGAGHFPKTELRPVSQQPEEQRMDRQTSLAGAPLAGFLVAFLSRGPAGTSATHWSCLVVLATICDMNPGGSAIGRFD